MEKALFSNENNEADRGRRKKTAAAAHRVMDGMSTPRFAAMAPGIPAACIPAKEAQFKPRGPWGISAMATMSVTCSAVIQPLLSTSLEI